MKTFLDFLRSVLVPKRLNTPPKTESKPRGHSIETDGDIQYAIRILKDAIADFRHLGKSTTIPAVVCITKFCGWGYVEGRTKGIKVNSRITLTDADSDLGFSQFAVLVDGIPSLIVEKSYRNIEVRVIGLHNAEYEMRETGWVKFNTVEEFKSLAIPLQVVLKDIMSHVMDHNNDRLADQSNPHLAPIEKLLDYSYGKSP